MKIVGKIYRKMLYEFDVLPFLIRNLIKSRILRAIPEVLEDGIVYRGLKKTDLSAIQKHQCLIPNGRALRWSRALLYYLIGKKLVIVGEEKLTGEVVGIQMFYFNRRDIKEKTIHATYIGVLPDHQGRGIGTKLLKKGMVHFSRFGISGTSMRISKNNIASIKMCVENLGFKPVEEYTVPSINKERYYLLYTFKKITDNEGSIDDG